MAEKRKFEIGRALKDSLGLWFRHLPLIAGLTIPYALLSALVIPHTSSWALSFTLGPWITALLWGVARREKGLRAGLPACLGHGLRLWPRMLGLGFMMSICCMAGLICLVLPLFYATVVISLAPALAYAEDRPAEEALNKSYELTRPHFWRLLVFWTVLLGGSFGAEMSLVLILELTRLLQFEAQSTWTAGNWLAWLFPYLMMSSVAKVGGLAVLKQLTAPTEAQESGVGFNPVPTL